MTDNTKGAVSVVPGAKVLNREPTEEMVSAAFLHFNRNTPPTNPSGDWKAALRGAWDAAPSLAPPAARDADLERAARLLEWCAESCRNYVKADNMEAWPYVPEMEEIAGQLRAAVGKAPAAPEVDGAALLRGFTESILHGDDKHRAWLRAECEKYLLSLAPAAKEKK